MMKQVSEIKHIKFTDIAKMTSIVLAVFTSVTMFNSCQEKVPFDFPNSPQKVVLNSILSPETLISAQLSLTMKVSHDEPTFVNDALVTIYENDILLDTLVCTGDGVYVSEHYPKAGCKYRIVAECGDYGICYAETNISRLPEITNLRYENAVSIDNEGTPIAKLCFTIKDTDSARNFYKVSMGFAEHQSGYEDYRTIYFLTTQNSDSVLTQSGCMVLDGGYLLFTDDYFENGSYNIEAFCRNYYVDPDFKISAISESYYEYIRSNTKQKFSDDGFFGEMNTLTVIPTNIFSNVENGYGIFAGYTSMIDIIKS